MKKLFAKHGKPIRIPRFAKKSKSEAIIWVSREKVVLLPKNSVEGAEAQFLCLKILSN